MKFAREFKAALKSGDYPEEWCKAAIPYPTLKKCLNKIRAEFQDMGLDADTLRQLLAAQAVSKRGDQIPLAKYKFDGRSHSPCFTFYALPLTPSPSERLGRPNAFHHLCRP